MGKFHWVITKDGTDAVCLETGTALRIYEKSDGKYALEFVSLHNPEAAHGNGTVHLCDYASLDEAKKGLNNLFKHIATHDNLWRKNEDDRPSIVALGVVSVILGTIIGLAISSIVAGQWLVHPGVLVSGAGAMLGCVWYWFSKWISTRVSDWRRMHSNDYDFR